MLRKKLFCFYLIKSDLKINTGTKAKAIYKASKIARKIFLVPDNFQSFRLEREKNFRPLMSVNKIPQATVMAVV